MTKYLDYPGLSYFWNKIKSWIKNYTHASYDQTTGRTTVVVDNITFDVSHKLPADYAPSTLENDALNLAANDSYDLAFSKIHKAMKDSEKVTAEVLTNLDSRIPTKTSQITNDSGYITIDDVPEAEVNQNAFSNVKVGNTTIAADAKTDTLELVAGSKITLTPNTTNDKVTFDVDDTLIIEVGENYTVPSGTYANITSALANNKIVIVKLSEETGITYFTLTAQGTSIYNFSFVAFTSMSGNSSAILSLIGIKNDDTVVINGGFLTDTKNTAGSTNSTSKLYIIGATSQAENPQTYSNKNAYVTSGKVYSNAKEVVNLSDTQTLTNKTLTSPSLNGTPTATTASAGTNNTQIATTAFVNTAISNNNSSYIPTSAKGTANGVATLGNDGKVPASQLPSYVDDVIEVYKSNATTSDLSSTYFSLTSGGDPIVPEAGKIYVLMQNIMQDNDDNDILHSINSQYRYSGSSYVQLFDGGVSSITTDEIDVIAV